jgi:hypothetical protein
MRYLLPALFVALATAAMAAPPVEVPTNLYMPLVPGMEWIYEDRVREERISVRSREDESGIASAIRLENLADGSEQVFRVEGGVRLMSEEVLPGGEIADYFDDPIPFAVSPTIKVPDDLEASPVTYRNPYTGGRVRWLVRPRRLVPCEVPFGKFEDCLEVHHRVYDERSGARVTNISRTYAPGIGLVAERGYWFGGPAGRRVDRELVWYYSPLDEEGVE